MINDKHVYITKYSSHHENDIFDLMRREGEEWEGYWGSNRKKYKNALESSITYLLYNDTQLCGFARCRNDDGFGLYIYDLLVDQKHRGNEYGQLLMDQVCEDFPDDIVYVMSDVDVYYQKLNYKKEGSIFIVSQKTT